MNLTNHRHTHTQQISNNSSYHLLTIQREKKKNDRRTFQYFKRVFQDFEREQDNNENANDKEEEEETSACVPSIQAR